jgi:hypothetical protein
MPNKRLEYMLQSACREQIAPGNTYFTCVFLNSLFAFKR